MSLPASVVPPVTCNVYGTLVAPLSATARGPPRSIRNGSFLRMVPVAVLAPNTTVPFSVTVRGVEIIARLESVTVNVSSSSANVSSMVCTVTVARVSPAAKVRVAGTAAP